MSEGGEGMETTETKRTTKRKAELIRKLNELMGWDDQETAHSQADHLLVEYINDEEIADAYHAIPKWYA